MFLVVVNPIAGNGRALKVFHKISSTALYQKLNIRLMMTQYEGHAKMIVKEETERLNEVLQGVIVIGGDGTLHEVINGLKGKNLSIGFIPGGSGNDFARGCAIERNPIKNFEKIIQQIETMPYFLGIYKTDDQGKQNYFVNSIGIGFDAEVAKVANQSGYKKRLNRLRLGRLSYIIALLQVLFRFRPRTVQIELNGMKKTINNCWMVTVANHPFYGGGMKIIPDARIEPEKFQLMYVHSLPKWKVLSLFILVFTGGHLKIKGVERIETTKVKITSPFNERLTVQVDGETVYCQTCTITKKRDAIYVNGTSNLGKGLFIS